MLTSDPMQAEADVTPEQARATLSPENLSAAPGQRAGKRRAVMDKVRILVEQREPRQIEELAESLVAEHPDIADRVLMYASKNLDDFPLKLAYCALADRRQDWPQSALRWGALRMLKSREPQAHIGYIDSMLAQGNVAEARRATDAALLFLKRRPAFLAIAARVASACGDWAQAAERWGAIVARQPDDAFAAAQKSEAEAHLAAGASAAPASPVASPSVPSLPSVAEMDEAERIRIRTMLSGFESIGINCEFGLLQRLFEAEPLGLLRFSTTRVKTLLTFLETRFESVGDPNQNEIVLVRNEYRLRNLVTGWRMHTKKMVQDGHDPAVLLQQQCRHTGFLRRKLVEDLERQTKIFVYQKSDLTDEEIEALYTSLERYGPNMLLCVRLPTNGRPAGDVEWRHERLMVATIDHKGQAFRGAGWDVSVDYWVHFCTLAQARLAELAQAE